MDEEKCAETSGKYWSAARGYLREQHSTENQEERPASKKVLRQKYARYVWG